MLKTKNLLLLLLLFSVIPLFSADKTDSISTKTAVIFNTLCAKCHEGECSGRLSFDNGSQAAKNHIKRYAGDIDISAVETKEFFTLLNYMKKKCALLMPDDGRSRPVDLSSYALPSHESYFIPLGILKGGHYSLHLETEENRTFRVEVLSDVLEPYLDLSIDSNDQEQALYFEIEGPINAFLRIRSRKALHIIDLEIQKDDRY